jgi:hypothetical protein
MKNHFGLDPNNHTTTIICALHDARDTLSELCGICEWSSKASTEFPCNECIVYNFEDEEEEGNP